MDTVFVDTTKAYTTSETWHICCDYQQLLITLRQASNRAAQSGQSVLASFTQPVEWCDPLSLFTGARQAGLGECFFWERPSEQHALIGIGVATTIETHGIFHITDTTASWHNLLQNAVITHSFGVTPGPIFFGGFAFDPLSSHTELWQDFPDGLLILPNILLSCSGDSMTLTVNRMIQASDDIEQCTEEIVTSLIRLHSAVLQQPQSKTTGGSYQLTLQDLRPASEWMDLVADTVNMIRQGIYEKVVLARAVRVTPQTPDEIFDVCAILHRLRQSYPGAYLFAIQRGNSYFVGATPEQLLYAQHGRIQTMALAGSAPRGATEEEDRLLGAELLQSVKNKDEHDIVVKMVREALANLCTRVWVADVPQLLKLKNVQHLKTPIVGELLPGRSILEAIAGLHPTPAVGGFPVQATLEAIRNGEQLDRGWYAGPIGWISANGNAEFAVALRSALVHENEAILFAGCGIVADSDPQSEYVESCLKLQVMLRGLGGEECED